MYSVNLVPGPHPACSRIYMFIDIGSFCSNVKHKHCDVPLSILQLLKAKHLQVSKRHSNYELYFSPRRPADAGTRQLARVESSKALKGGKPFF